MSVPRLHWVAEFACSALPEVKSELQETSFCSTCSNMAVLLKRHMQCSGKRNPIMVKMVPLGDNLLLQWMAPKSFKEPRVLDLNVNDYVDDAPSADEAAGKPSHFRAIPGFSAMDERTAGMQPAHVSWNTVAPG